MPLGESALATIFGMSLTRRATFTACRCLGISADEASRIADDCAIPAASAIAVAATILTLDPAGAAISAGYIALEHGEAEARAHSQKS